MAGGLLQSSVNDGYSAQGAASSLAALEARKFSQDAARRGGIEQGIGQLAGTAGGLLAAKYVSPGTRLPDAKNAPNIPTQGPTDNTISTMLGAVGSKLFGGFLNSKPVQGQLQSFNQDKF